MPSLHKLDAETVVLPHIGEHRTEHFRLRCAAGSFAAQRIDVLAARCESAYRRGSDWLTTSQPAQDALERHEQTITAYLTGSPASDTADASENVAVNDRGDIRVRVGPDAPGADLERAVLLVLTRAGGVMSPSPAALTALAGFLAATSGVGPSLDDLDRLAHERHVRGKTPAQLFAQGGPTQNATVPADISFLCFLEHAHGRPALARFALGLLRGDASEAALAACGQPLAALEQEWLDHLRGRFRGVMTGQDVLRRAIPLLRPHWLRGVELLGLMAVDLVFSLAIPLSSAYLFDEVIMRGEFSLLWIWLAVVLAIFAVGSVASYRRIVVGQLIGELVLRDLRRVAFARMQMLSQRFHARSSTGDLLQRIGGDLDNVQEALGQALPVLVFQLISLVVGAIALLVLSWQLGLIVLLLSAPIFGAVYARASDRLSEAARELQDRIGGFMGYVQENLSAQLLIKSYGLERRSTRAFDGILAQLFDGSLRLIRTMALLQSSSNMIFHGTRVVVLAVGALLVLDGQMTVGALVAFVALIVQVLQPVVAISEQYQAVQAAAGAFDRVQELMDEAPDVVEDPLATDLPALQHEIRLDRVNFSYANGHRALTDLSLTIPANARVAIVGPSGAGKSTLLGLLLRLHDPDAGHILLDGRDIQTATLSSLRRQIAYVPQETFLFNTTIAENIGLGREGATETEIASAADAAALARVIEQTEDGYQTLVGERGARLSGGQRQRLAIARALVRNPRLLILDEATSALDTETEAAILQTLNEVGRGRTVISITHRLRSVAQYDRIYVLDQGQLVEEGTHPELYGQRGLYWRLYREQEAASEPDTVRLTDDDLSDTCQAAAGRADQPHTEEHR